MTLDEFKAFIDGKSIAVVGNSLDALSSEQGEQIDSADLTLRFGKGAPPAPELFDRVGSRTDIWATGQLRMLGYKYLEPDMPILFNPSRYNTFLGFPPDSVHMFTEDTIEGFQTEYGAKDGKRLSAGAITALFLDRVANNWGSVTYYNFDCFTRHTMFYSNLTESNVPASSWHLPLIKPEHEPENWMPEDGNIAHDSDAEIAVFKDCLKRVGTLWRGKPLTNNPTYLETPYIQMTGGRRPPRWD